MKEIDLREIELRGIELRAIENKTPKEISMKGKGRGRETIVKESLKL